MDFSPTELRSFIVSRITLGRIALAAAAVLLVWALSDVVLLVFLAVLLAVVLRGAADWLAARTRSPPRLMLLLLALAGVLFAAGFTYWAGPRLAQQAHDLESRLAQQIGALRQHFENTPGEQPLAKQLSGPQAIAQHVGGTARAAIGMTFHAAADIVVLVVTTLYLAVAPSLYVQGAVDLFPIPHRPRALEVMRKIGEVLRGWMLGQLIDMATVGVLVALGLCLLGSPVPYALAVLAALLTFVPYFGAIVAGIPAVMVALTVSWSMALWTLAVYTGCHLIEGYLVAPLVQRRLIELPPALTVLSMAVMGTLFGTFGIIVGAPVTAVGLVLVRELYVGDVLGDR